MHGKDCGINDSAKRCPGSLKVFMNLVKMKQEQDEKYFADGEIGHTFSSTQGTQSA